MLRARVLDVDLTIPIAILGSAVALVLVIRAWLSWEERRMVERTAAFLREQGLDRGVDARRDDDVHDTSRGDRAPSSRDEP